MNLSNSPAEVTAAYAEVGAVKARRSVPYLILMGILAGAAIAFGSAATNTAVYGMDTPWIARMVCGLLFPFGLASVMIMGMELFTGNCLMVISVLEHKCTVLQMLRNWVIVYLSNFAGSLIVAAGCALFGQMNYSGGQLALFTMKMAAAKCSIPFANGVVLGFFCNLLVCLGVLMSMSGKDTTGRILGAFLPVCFFVTCGFEHCVANMFYIPAGLLARTVPAYAALAAEAGVSLEHLTISGCLLGNLLPVTLGNILGGAALGAILWFCHLKKN